MYIYILYKRKNESSIIFRFVVKRLKILCFYLENSQLTFFVTLTNDGFTMKG